MFFVVLCGFSHFLKWNPTDWPSSDRIMSKLEKRNGLLALLLKDVNQLGCPSCCASSELGYDRGSVKGSCKRRGVWWDKCMRLLLLELLIDRASCPWSTDRPYYQWDDDRSSVLLLLPFFQCKQGAIVLDVLLGRNCSSSRELFIYWKCRE